MKPKYVYGILTTFLMGCGLVFASNNIKLPEGEPISDEERTFVSAPAVPVQQVYVSPHWVHSVISGTQPDSKDYILIEVSDTALENTDSYLSGHLEGAKHLNIKTLEDETTGIVLSPEEVGSVLSSYGITKHTTVIFFTGSADNTCDDRAATIALWAGVTNVKCMEGGTESYIAAGYPVETLINYPEPTETFFGLEIPGRPEVFASFEDILEISLNAEKHITSENYTYQGAQADKNTDTSNEDSSSKHLVSMRSYAEYLGNLSGDDKITHKGEIQGASWGRDIEGGVYNSYDNSFVDISELNRILLPYEISTDDNHLIFYCIDGHKASIPYLIAYQGGATEISIYDGGWKEWTTVPDNPVQVGDPLTIDVQYKTVNDIR